MGFFTGLLTLPLAPVRGTVWIAEKVAEEAARHTSSEPAIRQRLLELELRHDMGEIDDDEFAAAESALLDELVRAREREPHG
jgi:Gas vesicle protein G